MISGNSPDLFGDADLSSSQLLGQESQGGVQGGGEIDSSSQRFSRSGHVEKRLNDAGNPVDLFENHVETPGGPLPFDRAVEGLCVSSDHAHRRSNLMGETADQGRNRRQLFRFSGTRFGLAQIVMGFRDLLGQRPPLGFQLVVEVAKVMLSAVDVLADCDFRIEHQPLLERRDRRVHGGGLVAQVVAHDGNQEAEVQRVGAEIPAGVEADAFVRHPDQLALSVIRVVDIGIGKAQQISALGLSQSLAHRGIGQQGLRLGELLEMVVEPFHQFVGIRFEGTAQLMQRVEIGLLDSKEVKQGFEFV